MPAAEDIYLFRHAAYRDVAYGLQLPSDRAGLHILALEILERVFSSNTDAIAHELADHARQAREQGADAPEGLIAREARYLEVAIQRARHRAQWGTVCQLCERALELGVLDGDAERATVRRLAEAQRTLGRIAESEENYERLHEMACTAGLNTARAEALIELGTIRTNRGEEEGRENLRRAEELARKAPADTQPQLMARVYMVRSQFATTHTEVETLLEEARRAIAGHEASTMYRAVEGSIANHLGSLGRHEESIRIIRGLIDVFKKHGEDRNVSVSWANIGRQYLLLGNHAAAEEALGKAIELAATVGNARTEAFARSNRATLQMRRGAFEDAATNVDRAIEIARDHEINTFHAAYLCNRAELQLLLGHEGAAREDIENARAEFIAAGGEPFVAEYCGILRLRIAASEAVSAPLPGRETSSLTAGPPNPTWLPVLRSLQGELQDALKLRERPGALLVAAQKEGAALVTEIEAAIRDLRPAMLFRGHLVERMLPALRRALVERMTPGESAAVKATHPALWRVLHA
jgi:tetratricopeptide (TPR) repeat protein